MLEKQLGAPGEFARAYVLAHEVGHHVQRLLGYSARVDEARRTTSQTEYNKMSVRLELQADFLAGVWAHHAHKKYKFLEKGDLESATNAAFRIGDDVLQKQARGRVSPGRVHPRHGQAAAALVPGGLQHRRREEGAGAVRPAVREIVMRLANRLWSPLC